MARDASSEDRLCAQGQRQTIEERRMCAFLDAYDRRDPAAIEELLEDPSLGCFEINLGEQLRDRLMRNSPLSPERTLLATLAMADPQGGAKYDALAEQFYFGKHTLDDLIHDLVKWGLIVEGGSREGRKFKLTSTGMVRLFELTQGRTQSAA
jgi:hypothetical protein